MVTVDCAEFFYLFSTQLIEGFGHRRTDSKLEPAVDSAVDSAFHSAVDLVVDGATQSPQTHTQSYHKTLPYNNSTWLTL